MINAYSVTNTPGYIGLANLKGNIYRGNMRMPAEGLIQYKTILIYFGLRCRMYANLYNRPTLTYVNLHNYTLLIPNITHITVSIHRPLFT